LFWEKVEKIAILETQHGACKAHHFATPRHALGHDMDKAHMDPAMRKNLPEEPLMTSLPCTSRIAAKDANEDGN
jgi:hypothetical protein